MNPAQRGPILLPLEFATARQALYHYHRSQTQSEQVEELPQTIQDVELPMPDFIPEDEATDSSSEGLPDSDLPDPCL